MNKITEINIYTDGGSRGNPGPSALGVYIESVEKVRLAEIGKSLGINTNNFAEYSAIVSGLEWIVENKNTLSSLKQINFYMDSLLAVSQINGLYKIKNSMLRELYFKVKSLEATISIPISYTHIRREKNKNADRLVNLALDNSL